MLIFLILETLKLKGLKHRQKCKLEQFRPTIEKLLETAVHQQFEEYFKKLFDYKRTVRF